MTESTEVEPGSTDAGGSEGANGARGEGRHVLLIPVYASNPYSRLLASSLREQGVEVSTSGISGRLPLVRAVRAHGWPDLVHLQWQHRFLLREEDGPVKAAVRTLLFFAQVVLLRMLGIRFVWTVHNLVNHERHLVRLERVACRRLARLVDGILVHCRTASDRVVEEYGVSSDRLSVVPHGHYIGWYPDPPDRDEARGDLDLPEDGRVLLHFGQIRPYKGVGDLVRAFSALDGADEMRLVILGAPRYEELGDRLRDLAADDRRIRLDLRYASEEELVKHIAAADAVVLPYTDALTSGSAVLAASCGRPVVAPTVGCLRDFPDDAIIGYPPHGPDALAKALDRVRSAQLERMGRAARRFIEGFPWARVGEATVSLYEEVLPRSTKRPGAPGKVAA